LPQVETFRGITFWTGKVDAGPVEIEIVAPSAPATATPTAKPTQPAAALSAEAARALAEQRWGGEYRIREGVNRKLLDDLTPLDSERLRRLLPGWRFYRAQVWNPESMIAGPNHYFYALATDGGEPAYLASDEEAAKFLAERQLALADEAAMIELVRAFGELRSYTLQEEQPAAGAPAHENYPDPEAAKAIVWKTICTPVEGGWAVGCTFLTDPVITSCSRYAFRVGRGGEFALEKQEYVWRNGGYR
jgi:hypothetical protein